MDTNDNTKAKPRRKISNWIYVGLFLLIATGVVYVLLAPLAGNSGASSDRTPLGAAVLAYIQKTVQASAASPIFWLLALPAAFLLGGLHTLTPGHNKTLVGTYLVGARGRLFHAVLIGMVTAFAHTASALVIGVLALSVAGQIASTQYLRWIGLPSGIATVGLGLWLLKKYFDVNPTPSHPHPHDHDHDHNHLHEHDHDHSLGHEHSHPLPAPDHVTLGGLVVLGLMHGLIPTFDALAIILVALNVQRPILGVGLILAYSLGLGSVLVAVGLLFIRAHQALLDQPRFVRLSHKAPALAALVVILLGLVLIVRTIL